MPNLSWRTSIMWTALLSAFLLGGCKPERVVYDGPTLSTGPDDPLSTWMLPNVVGEPVLLTVPTYENSGQAVHADVLAFPDGWNGAHYWMAMTPYPGGSSYFENPSILVSNDGLALSVPPGLTNPVVAQPGATSYNSDPDLVYDATQHEIVMSYRLVQRGWNRIRIVTTHDGVHWTDPHEAFAEPNHSAVSQSIVTPVRGMPAMVWYVDAGPDGCQARSTRVMVRSAPAAPISLAAAEWSEPRATDLSIPGYWPWHLKVSYIPSKREYWALVVAYPDDGRGCGADDLFFAHSKNGVQWEVFPQPLMRHGKHAWSAGALYRGSFLYSAKDDELAIWFSARDDQSTWRLGFVRMKYAALAARLSHAPASTNVRSDTTRAIWTTAP